MDEIKIVYVDDNVDSSISKYLAEDYNHKNFKKNYNEITFDNKNGYESLINNEKIKEANIIVIDSRLFENNIASKGKFSGEEFKIILKKIFPFIEVIVISQEPPNEYYGMINKYQKNSTQTAQQYYEAKLKSALDSAIENIEIYRNISNKLKKSKSIDEVLIQRIMDSLDGSAKYETLTSKDIDNIITAFEEIQRGISEQGL